jgi:hypothetical protein
LAWFGFDLWQSVNKLLWPKLMGGVVGCCSTADSTSFGSSYRGRNPGAGLSGESSLLAIYSPSIHFHMYVQKCQTVHVGQSLLGFSPEQGCDCIPMFGCVHAQGPLQGEKLFGSLGSSESHTLLDFETTT